MEAESNDRAIQVLGEVWCVFAPPDGVTTSEGMAMFAQEAIEALAGAGFQITDLTPTEARANTRHSVGPWPSSGVSRRPTVPDPVPSEAVGEQRLEAVAEVERRLREMAYRPFGPDDFPKLEELADSLAALRQVREQPEGPEGALVHSTAVLSSEAYRDQGCYCDDYGKCPHCLEREAREQPAGLREALTDLLQKALDAPTIGEVDGHLREALAALAPSEGGPLSPGGERP